MNQRTINRLLKELTPEIRSYLFPGMDSGGYSNGGQSFSDIPDFDPRPWSGIGSPACLEADSRSFSGLVLQRMNGHRPRKSRAASAPVPPEAPSAGPDADALDPRTEEILAEILRLQEKYGVTVDELEVILGYTVKLSTLRITRGGKIFLSEYGDGEVKMPSIARALYFLYLLHPEGLRYKEVAGHRDELLRIYGDISGRDDPEEMEKSIDLLVDPYGNALNVNASRVKTAFRNVVSDRIARFYYINGAAGDVKKVPLDRDLVLWDY